MESQQLTTADIGTPGEAEQITANLAAGLTWDGREINPADVPPSPTEAERARAQELYAPFVGRPTGAAGPDDWHRRNGQG